MHVLCIKRTFRSAKSLSVIEESDLEQWYRLNSRGVIYPQHPITRGIDGGPLKPRVRTRRRTRKSGLIIRLAEVITVLHLFSDVIRKEFKLECSVTEIRRTRDGGILLQLSDVETMTNSNRQSLLLWERQRSNSILLRVSDSKV
ncbi:hypothetical protein J6590_088556 [Homalodisca vitripennis]|nr:hypothetical protein J6590_088556 [Homalodisca vitripennis]